MGGVFISEDKGVEREVEIIDDDSCSESTQFRQPELRNVSDLCRSTLFGNKFLLPVTQFEARDV